MGSVMGRVSLRLVWHTVVIGALTLAMSCGFAAPLLAQARNTSAPARNTTGPTAGATPLRLDWQQAADTARFIARWQRPCNASGCADSVRIAWTLNGVAQPVRTRAHPLGATWVPDTVRTLRAWCPAPTTASLTLTFTRRGVAIAPITRTATMGCRDQVLTPPDSFVIDTGFVWRGAVRVDSSPRVHASTAADRYLVTRSDSSRVGVQVLYAQYTLLGARIDLRACADGTWWTTGDTTSVRVAQATASQWPVEALRARARAAFRAYADPARPLGVPDRAAQQGCTG